VGLEYDKFVKENEQLKKDFARFIVLMKAADPRPDLSCHKYITAFEFIEEQIEIFKSKLDKYSQK